MCVDEELAVPGEIMANVLMTQMTSVRSGWIRWGLGQAVYWKIMMRISGGRLEN